MTVMTETGAEREDRLQKRAYTEGRRDADVDAHLRSHENRLNAINGSIERHAKNALDLRESILELGDKVDGIAATLSTQKAVEADRVRQIKAANEKQITTRQFWLGVATICVMILVALYAKSKGFG